MIVSGLSVLVLFTILLANAHFYLGFFVFFLWLLLALHYLYALRFNYKIVKPQFKKGDTLLFVQAIVYVGAIFVILNQGKNNDLSLNDSMLAGIGTQGLLLGLLLVTIKSLFEEKE